MKDLTAAEVIQIANIKHVERALGEKWMHMPCAEASDASRAAMLSIRHGNSAGTMRYSLPETQPKIPTSDGDASSYEGQVDTIATDNPFAALGDDSSGSESSCSEIPMGNPFASLRDDYSDSESQSSDE